MKLTKLPELERVCKIIYVFMFYIVQMKYNSRQSVRMIARIV